MKRTNKELARWFIQSVQDVDTQKQNNVADVLIEWLAERGELGRLREIIKAIDLVWKEMYGASTITVVSAHPLTKSLHTALEKRTSGAEIKEVVDPTLIGGAIIRMDESVIDGSLLSALNQLKNTLLT